MHRRHFLRLLPVLAATVLCNLPGPIQGAEPFNFNGEWESVSNETNSFYLDLKQTGDQVSGYHVSTIDRGRRVDGVMSDEGKPSITGKVVDGVLRVHFRSGYDEAANGEATLTRKGDKLIWKITETTGNHYLPESSTLRRSKPEKKSKK